MTQTHADVPEHIRKQNGITDCVLRMSVGIENVKDLLNELEEVFAKKYEVNKLLKRSDLKK